MLDLDHVGTEIGELLRAQRSGDDPREVDHADPFERRGVARDDRTYAGNAMTERLMTPRFINS